MTKTKTAAERLIDFLRPLAEGADVKSECWITSDRDDVDQALSYCPECVAKEIARLESLYPDDYFGQGTNGGGMDYVASCAICYDVLDNWLSEGAIEDELDHYAEHPVDLKSPLDCENLWRVIDNAQGIFTPEQEKQLERIAAILDEQEMK